MFLFLQNFNAYGVVLRRNISVAVGVRSRRKCFKSLLRNYLIRPLPRSGPDRNVRVSRVGSILLELCATSATAKDRSPRQPRDRWWSASGARHAGRDNSARPSRQSNVGVVAAHERSSAPFARSCRDAVPRVAATRRRPSRYAASPIRVDADVRHMDGAVDPSVGPSSSE